MKITIIESVIREVDVDVPDNMLDPDCDGDYLEDSEVRNWVYDYIALNGWDHEEVDDVIVRS